eukprot:snap_masked-scaffold_44-processed-gene-1.33-mRNA-1 protein AED:0.38 eAED:0.38 QI:0/-1/0/1/-1/1/1/0/376
MINQWIRSSRITGSLLRNHRSLAPTNLIRMQYFSTSNNEKEEKSEEIRNEGVNASDKFKSFLQGFQSSAKSSFDNDPTTWKDALRNIFNLKPVDKITKMETERLERVKIHQENKANPDYKPPTTSELVVQKVEEVNTSDPIWKRFSSSLSFQSSELFTKLLGEENMEKISEQKEKVKDKVEEARQTFETSQNPVVYKVYSAYETVLKDSPAGETIKEWRKNEPHLSFDENEIVKTIEDPYEDDGLIPKVLDLYFTAEEHLDEVDLELEKYCGEKARMGIRASGQQRVAIGQRMSGDILSIGDTNVLKVEDGKVLIRTMVQQIDCLYDLTGEIVEGGEDKVVAVWYVFGLSRKYFEEEFRYRWFCEEFAVIGQQTYI